MPAIIVMKMLHPIYLIFINSYVSFALFSSTSSNTVTYPFIYGLFFSILSCLQDNLLCVEILSQQLSVIFFKHSILSSLGGNILLICNSTSSVRNYSLINYNY